MAFSESVNPARIRPGDRIVTGRGKSRVVKSVGACGKLECIHLDHECYDTRFSSVERIVRG